MGNVKRMMDGGWGGAPPYPPPEEGAGRDLCGGFGFMRKNPYPPLRGYFPQRGEARGGQFD